MKKIIELQNLKFSYEDNGRFDIDDISLKIFENEYIAIIGQNGSGKSTLAKLLVSILKPNFGKVIIDDIEVSRKTLFKVRKKIGVVFQNPENQFIGTTVYDDIAFGLENHNVPSNKMDKIIRDCAAQVGISDLLKSEPSALSGGQKQKVAIATIFALKSDIVVFDEATSMLDPKGKKEVNQLMHDLKNKFKKTVISITHDMNEACKADRILLIDRSRKLYFDTPENIFFKHGAELEKIGLDIPDILKVAKAIKFENTLNEGEVIRAVQAKLSKHRKKNSKPIITKQSATKPALKIKCANLNFIYLKGYPGQKQALKNVDCNFYDGKINGIIGNTGCGKSTLIQHINALLRSRTGHVSLNIDSDMFKISRFLLTKNKKIANVKKLRANVGLVFQLPEYQLFNSSVKKEIAFAAINFGQKSKEAYAAVPGYLDLVDLDRYYLNQNPFNLSGGQKRRVAIASVISYKPKILILDEPTAGLDPSGVRQILKIITDLNKQGVTIILVTHEMDHILEISDNVSVFRAGKLVKVDQAYNLFKDAAFLKSNSLTPPIVFDFLKKIDNPYLWTLPNKSINDLVSNLQEITNG